MKKLLGILVLGLLLITPSQADDIRDFEIEGMSIGDSALDFFSEEEIKNNSEYWWPDKTYTQVPFSGLEFLKTYDDLDFSYKTDDKKYKIYSITGIIWFDNINDCHKKQKEIDQEFSEIYKNTKKKYTTYTYDKERFGNSTSKQILYNFKSKDGIVLECKDWENKFQTEGWRDNLSISLDTKEFQAWLRKVSN